MFNKLNIVEIKTRYYSLITKISYIIIILLFFYPISVLFILLFTLIFIIIEVIYNKNEKNTLTFKYKNNLIGFINGKKDYIHKCMILPEYQKKGIGTFLLNTYLKKFCKNCSSYHFKTSIFLDSLYIYTKYKNCIINTTNYITYSINVPLK